MISMPVFYGCERSHVQGLRAGPIQLLAQDKGGPSQGGFLNNILCSYTDLYLCSEIHGMCI